ncbi:glycosyltransferase family 2 protein [soil metagenome]
MRFQGLMLLRDEEDIIAQNLEHLLTWIDALYILDLGSSDRTWEIVQDFARREPRIVPFMHRPILYDDNLRSFIFSHFRDRFSPGDWVFKIDADEFYHIPPPQFVKERLRAGESAVNLLWYYFRLTQQEVVAYENGAVDVMEDRKRPIELRRPFYQIAKYSEPRMFRYRRSMQWPEVTSFPYNAGFVARERIPIRHYPHRDPLQMARRYELRASQMKLKAHAGGHWKLDDWHKDLVDPEAASSPTRTEGVSTMSGLDHDQVHHWQPGSPLPELHPMDHLPDWKTRLAQRIVHPMLLPLLDPKRRKFNTAYQPTYTEDLPAT